MLDRAFWVTWYDLPAEGREKYLEWLHGSFIPKMLKKPGFLHAAHYQSEIKIKPEARLNQLNDPDFPRGNQFMLVFGGGCALAGLAGVIGGNAFVTEPAMAATVGSIIFVVVVLVLSYHLLSLLLFSSII